jgi:hypothetical protein
MRHHPDVHCHGIGHLSLVRWSLVLIGVALLAGCGGGSQTSAPTVALLTAVHVDGTSARFEFESAPATIRTHFRPRAQIAESGSGRKVPLKGSAFLVVSFSPAATATADADKVSFSYTGPKRLEPSSAGPVQEVAKIGDFEAQLDWAIGLDLRRAPQVTRDGNAVTVAFADGP